MEPIKIEVTLKADDSLVFIAQLIVQSLAGLVANAPKTAPKGQKPKKGEIVHPEGEIVGKPVVTTPEEEHKDTPAPEEAKDNPFEGVDEENSVDLSDLDDEPKNEPAPAADSKPVTHEDARVAVKVARERGVGPSQVKAIITGMGFEQLNDVPVERLHEFIAKVEAL